MPSFFEELCEIANTDLNNKDKVIEYSIRLERLVLGQHDHDEDLIILRLKKEGWLIKLQILYEVYKTELETVLAHSFLNGDKKFEELMSDRAKILIESEISIGRIEADDKMLFIGSGPLPMSAILYNKYAGCQIDCIEKDKNMVDISQKVLAKLGLAKSVNVYCKNGEKLKADKYDVIVVALLAKPKNKILESIFTSMEPTTRVICRTADTTNKILYEETDKKLFDRYGFNKKNVAGTKQTVSSVFYLGD
ncbi:hypothetical protein KBC75_06190 [Candidatus Shapirobacteria bacterium]|nr:hypothetical protein [Candidatus Shapirobacteria bacterium]